MGSAESSYQQRFHSKYSFVQPIHDPNYGPLRVYRKKEPIFDYVAVIDRPLSSTQLTQAKRELQLVRSSLAREEPPMLLRVFNVEQLQSGRCGSQSLRVYLEYLTFSLKDEIAQRRTAFHGFSLQEIAYVMHSAIDTYLHMQNINSSHLSLRPETVLVTVEGLVRFSPLRVIDFNQEKEEGCDCMPEPVVQNYFQKTQRQFLVELKNLLHELVSITPKTDPDFANNYELLTNVNHSRTIANLRPFLPPLTIDCLPIAKKVPQSTEFSTLKDVPPQLNHSNARSKRSLRQSGTITGQFLR